MRSFEFFPGVQFSGVGEVSGVVTVVGGAARKRVFLMDKFTRRIVRSTISASNGTYAFQNVDPARKYVAIAFDDQLQFNAVIRDNITPFVNE